MSRDDNDDRPGRRYGDEDRPPGSNGSATAALVLGIIGLCTGPLLSIPAIICGVLGLSRSKQTGTGQGPAVAGLVLGVIGTLLTPAILIALLLPAVQKVRKAAGRQHDMNNLRQIGLAVANREATTGRLPWAYVRGQDGQPNRGLSWRVELLPYLEQENLYQQFKLDQAWDSPANRQPSQVVVSQYRSTNDPQDNQTRFRVFVGPGTMFEDTPEWLDKASLAGITDGTSNTIMVVETADRVPWASPQDIPYQPGGPLPALGQPNRNVILVAFADGSVRSLKKTISPQVLHALITRNGNETLPANWDQ